MPRNFNKAAVSGKAALPQISAQLLEELIPGPVTKEQFEDIFQNFKKVFIDRALNAEMSHHLGNGPGQAKPEDAVTLWLLFMYWLIPQDYAPRGGEFTCPD